MTLNNRYFSPLLHLCPLCLFLTSVCLSGVTDYITFAVAVVALQFQFVVSQP